MTSYDITFCPRKSQFLLQQSVCVLEGEGEDLGSHDKRQLGQINPHKARRFTCLDLSDKKSYPDTREMRCLSRR